MALYYLSGDKNSKMQVGKSAKAKKRQEDRKKKKADKKASGKPKTVVKIALAPARGAFLTIVSLNLFKIATKLVKLWNKSATAKSDLQKMWVGKFGGDVSKLKEAIQKGSKTSISGNSKHSVGIATEVLLASALPIIIALRELFKRNSLPDDTTEETLGDAVDQGSEELEKNPTNYGTVGPATGKNPTYSKDGVEAPDDGGEPNLGSFFSAWGMCWWGMMLTGRVQSELLLNHPILLIISSLLGLYFVLGFLFFGWIYQTDHKWKKYISWYFDIPKNFFIKIYNYGLQIVKS